MIRFVFYVNIKYLCWLNEYIANALSIYDYDQQQNKVYQFIITVVLGLVFDGEKAWKNGFILKSIEG